MENTREKSIHVFAWPFGFEEKNCVGKKTQEKHFLIDQIERGDSKWEMIDFNPLTSKNINMDSFSESFRVYHYLSGPARRIFLGDDGEQLPGFCKTYRYDLSGGDFAYFIELGEERYELPIEDIALHIYEQGAGVLLIRVINKEYDEKTFRKIRNAATRIRLTDIKTVSEDAGADKIGIIRSGDAVCQGVNSVTDYQKLIKEGNAQKLVRSARFLYDLLDSCLCECKSSDLSLVHETTHSQMYVLDISKDTLSEEFCFSLVLAQSILLENYYVKMQSMIFNLEEARYKGKEAFLRGSALQNSYRRFVSQMLIPVFTHKEDKDINYKEYQKNMMIIKQKEAVDEQMQILEKKAFPGSSISWQPIVIGIAILFALVIILVKKPLLLLLFAIIALLAGAIYRYKDTFLTWINSRMRKK